MDKANLEKETKYIKMANPSSTFTQVICSEKNGVFIVVLVI